MYYTLRLVLATVGICKYRHSVADYTIILRILEQEYEKLQRLDCKYVQVREGIQRFGDEGIYDRYGLGTLTCPNSPGGNNSKKLICFIYVVRT